MQGHRLLRAVAVLILIVAVVYLALTLGGALMLGSRGFGSGWGTGWTGWLVLPLAGAAVMAGLTLLVFGLMLYFLAKIDDNLTAAREQGWVVRRARPVRAFAPAVAQAPPAAVAAAGGAVVAAAGEDAWEAEPRVAEVTAEPEPTIWPEAEGVAAEERAVEAAPAETDLGPEPISAGIPPEVEFQPPVQTVGAEPEPAPGEAQLPRAEVAEFETAVPAAEGGSAEETFAEETFYGAEVAEPEPPFIEAAAIETPVETAEPEVELERVELEAVEPQELETEDMTGWGEPESILPVSDLAAGEVAGLREEAAEAETRLPQIEIADDTPPELEPADAMAVLSEETGVPEPELASGVQPERAEERGMEAPAPAAAAPTGQVDLVALQSEVAALRAQLSHLQAQLAAGLGGAAVAAAGERPARGSEHEAEDLVDELPEAVPAEPPAQQPAAGKLPGSDEVARIAAEMAAVKGKSLQPPQEPPVVGAGAEGFSGAPAHDNLEIIQGVGAIYAKRLREVGITTYKQLAEATYEQLVKVTHGNLERVVKEDWRGQARRLMDQK